MEAILVIVGVGVAIVALAWMVVGLRARVSSLSSTAYQALGKTEMMEHRARAVEQELVRLREQLKCLKRQKGGK